MSEFNSHEEASMAEINAQTARISWQELQRFFATGNCVYIAPELDLVMVALHFARDDAAQIKSWKERDLLMRVSDEQAKIWLAEEAELWTVVIKPWVLVQQDKFI